MKKNTKILFLTLLAAFFYCGAGLAWGLGKPADEAALLAKAGEKGTVRVLVSFSARGVSELQKASRSFKVSIPGLRRSRDEISSIRQADAALAAGIKSAADGVFGGLGLEKKVLHVFSGIPLALLEVSRNDLISLSGGAGVTRVVEDQPIPLSDEPAVEGAVGGERDSTSYGVKLVRAPEAWAKGYDGSGWYVAVLDTGVRSTHEMFTGKEIAEACFSSNVNDYSSSLCPGGVVGAEGPGTAVPPDQYGHGTHVAGIAVGRQPTGGLRGVAPGADLIAVQVFSYLTDWDDVGSWVSDQIKGLEYVYGLRVQYPIAAVNISIGAGRYYAYCDGDSRKPVIDNLRAAGVAVIAANGNGGYCGSLGAPACISSVVSVGGSDYNDRHYYYNDWHPTMQDIFAPGVNIYSAVALADDGYQTKTGTSMAAPHVAGAFAVFRQAAPTVSVSEIERVMAATGAFVESGCDTEPSFGPRLDVAAVADHFWGLNAVPTADAGPDQAVDEEMTVVLDGSGSTGHSGHGLTYAWVQTGGADVTLSDPASVGPTFTSPKTDFDGEALTFELTVTDNFSNLTATDGVTVVVANSDRFKPPTADAGLDQDVATGTTTRLDGSTSTSNSGSGASLSHVWTQTKGVVVTLSDPNSAAPTFVAPAVDGSSVLVFQLTVVDTYNQLASSDEVRVTVSHIDSGVDPGFLPAASHEGPIVGFKTEGGDSALVSIDPVDPAELGDEGVRPNIAKYFFNKKIKCRIKAVVQVVIQLPQPAPENAKWYKYSDVTGWSEYPATLNDDRTKATFKVTDGGEGDQDNAADGMIMDPSGLGYALVQTLPGSSSGNGSCFIDAVLDGKR
ncbi:MAG: S8 family serine peptidase [Pseudomonadota bacterium]